MDTTNISCPHCGPDWIRTQSETDGPLDVCGNCGWTEMQDEDE